MLAGAVALFFLIDAFGADLTAPAPTAPGRKGPDAAAGKPDALIHVLIALTAVVVTGRLLGVLLRYLGQPAVIGEVLGGIALGPSLLGRVAPDVSAFLLPPSVAPYLG